MIKQILIAGITIAAVAMTSCATFQKAEPYFEVAASIGTTEFINSAKDATTRASYVSIVREVAGVIQTLSSGALLTPEQFNAEIIARLPKDTTVAHFTAVVTGVYAVAYLDFKDRPELKNDEINRLATVILAAAH